MARNVYEYSASKGREAAKNQADKENNKLFVDSYFKAQELNLKKQQMAQQAMKDNTTDPLKQFTQLATLAAQGLIDPAVVRATQPLANAAVMQKFGLAQAPQMVPQVAAQAPGQMSASRSQPLGIDPRVTPKQEQDIIGDVAGQNALMPGAVEETRQKEAVKDVTEMQGGALKSGVTSQYNLDTVSNALLPLSQVMADAYEEGGAGNVLKKSITNLAQGGWLPEDIQEDFSESTAVSGKRTEVLLKMMPLISSQFGKEGSTRIIKGVFDKLGESLPDTQNAPLNAIKMINNSVDTLYGVVRAIENVDLSAYDINNKDDENKLINKIKLLAENLEIVGEEKEAIDGLKQKIVQPIQIYRAKKELAKRRGL